MILLCLVLTVIFEGAGAVYCTHGYGIFRTQFYCSDYCCGDNCCYYTYMSWSGARIAGAVIGGIIALCFLVGLIIFAIKLCTKSGTRGSVVHTAPSQPPAPSVFFVNTGAGPSGYPQTPNAMGRSYSDKGISSYPPP